MAAREWGESRRARLWSALAMFVVIVGFVYATMGAFNKSFSSFVPVTLVSDRSGLVMEVGAKVKLRGVQVGEVGTVTGGNTPVTLKLNLFPDQIKFIPANVAARIQATTIFGAKYVELVYPSDPSAKRLASGAVLQSENVSTEVNTVFENLVGLLNQVDPAKLNAILSALAQGVRGQGERIGEATTGLNEVLLQLNPRSETIRADFRSLKGFADTYSAAAQNILTALDAASTTSETVNRQSKQLDSLLLNITGFANSGINLLAPNRDNFVRAINDLQSTTALLNKYNPEYTCLLLGAKTLLDTGYPGITGGDNGKSLVVDAALLFGKDQYRYPDNLPIVGAKGGPGGRPGCGSLPDVAKNWPVRDLVTNTGWGHRGRHSAQPWGWTSVLHRSLPGDARHPAAPDAAWPGSRSCTRTDSVPWRSSVWRAHVCAGRHPALPRRTAGATARPAKGTRSATPGVGTLRGAESRRDAAQSAGNPASGTGSTVTVTPTKSSDPNPDQGRTQ